MLKRRREQPVPPQSGRGVPGSGAAVYEVDGRVLIRTVDGSDRLGIERDEFDALDGYPDIDVDLLGGAIVTAVERAREVPRPTTWRSQTDYAASLLAASPRRYRSYRAWQRAARHVSVDCAPEGWRIIRLHPDLGGGGWEYPKADDHDPALRVERHLPVESSLREVGLAVLECLEEPPLAR